MCIRDSYGGADNDRLLGRAGADFIWGGDGFDLLDGGADFDPVLDGGPGVDIIWLGTGGGNGSNGFIINGNSNLRCDCDAGNVAPVRGLGVIAPSPVVVIRECKLTPVSILDEADELLPTLQPATLDDVISSRTISATDAVLAVQPQRV